MSQAAVQLKVAGQTYRVVTSAPAGELERLAARVEDALAQVTPRGRQASPQALVLAAITLAHELEEEREKRAELERRYRSLLESVVGRLDHLLGDAGDASRQPDAARPHTHTHGFPHEALASDAATVPAYTAARPGARRETV